MLQHAVTDAFFEFSFCKFTGFEELFNQFFVVFGNTLHELCSPFSCFVCHVGRNLSFFDICAQIVLIDVGLVAHQIDNSAQVTFSTNRKLNGGSFGFQAINDLSIDLEEVSPGSIHLVDEHHAGNAVTIRLTPNSFRLRLNTTHGAEDGNHAIEHTHGTLHLNGEVHVTGGINDVDAVVIPRSGYSRSSNGDAALALLGHPVSHGGAIVHLANLVHHA